ncbi:hypothetical protein [Anaeromyxobacter oryzae]|uniref:Outer membrane protein beta-barrel domain-containing protein n=1 Tax=Anaeromyxobacter oryzae TaxID=2918170 RepID=A0ABN6MXI7_9BACT|nr:hypothetical protein [Anaeromyxobacter oryzae]BDG04443.1 hypothetical protein AMOR_34390 [Anaeromyxobacter oryzae]
MRTRLVAVLAAAGALALATPARADVSPNSPWSLTLTVWGGVSRYDVLGLAHGVSSVQSQDGRDLLQGDFDAYGGAAVLRLGWLDLGGLYEGALLRSRSDSAVVTPLVGVALNLTDWLRLDLLGELGGHRISNIGLSQDLDPSQAKSVWLPYVGVRPTLAFRVPFGPARLVLSAAPFARWDLVQKQVTVNVSGTTTQRNTYDVGGSTYGVVGGMGIEL